MAELRWYRWSRAMALSLTLALLAPAAARAADVPPATRAALDAALGKAFAATKAPGVVVGIWIPDEGSYVATRGVSDIKTRQPIRIDDHFRIGSITKTFTATLLLIFADEEKLGLDDPVSKYVAWVPNGDKITLRMLADMTAGLHSYTEDDAWVKTMFSNLKRVWTPRELVDVGLKSPPDFAPGQGWHYSNTNYVLLGMILEQVAGKKIQDAFAEKMFKPLKLTQTSWPVGGALPNPYAHGTTVQSLDDTLADATHRDPSWAFTAGELVSTMADLRTWVVSYTTGTLVSPADAKATADLDDHAAHDAGARLRHRHRHRPRLARPYRRAAGVQLQRVLPARQEGGDGRDGELGHPVRQGQSGADDHEGTGPGRDAGQRAAVS